MKVASKLAYVGVVTIQDGDAGNGQTLHEFIFCTRDAGNSVGKILGVGRAHVGDDSPIRMSDAGQGRDLAGMRHAHLDDSNLVFRLQLQQLQRHAEFVVQVSL